MTHGEIIDYLQPIANNEGLRLLTFGKDHELSSVFLLIALTLEGDIIPPKEMWRVKRNKDLKQAVVAVSFSGLDKLTVNEPLLKTKVDTALLTLKKGIEGL